MNDSSIPGAADAPRPHSSAGDGPGDLPAGAHAPGSRPPAGNTFFTWLRGLGIVRSQNRWIAGVAEGIALRTGLDPALVRGIFIVFGLFGVGLLAYGVAWALLPEPDGRIQVEEAMAGRWTSGMTGALVFSILGLGGPGVSFWAQDGWLAGSYWGVFWVAGVIVLVYWLSTRDRDSARPGPVRAGNPAGPSGPLPYAQGAASAGPDGAASAGPDGAARTVPAGTEDRYGAPEATPSGPFQTPGHWTGSHSPDSTEGRYGNSGTGGYGSGAGYGAYDSGKTYGSAEPNAAKDDGREPACSSTPPAGWTMLLLGAALLAAGILLALDYTGYLALNAPGATALAVAAGVLGLGIVMLGCLGRSSGPSGSLAVLALAGSLVAGGNLLHPNLVVANQSRWSVGSAGAADDGYTVAAGQGNLDLTDLADELARRDVTVPVSVAAGDLAILVPDDVPVSVRSDMVLGNVSLEDQGSTQVSAGIWTGGDEMRLNGDDDGFGLIIEIRGVVSHVLITTNESGIER